MRATAKVSVKRKRTLEGAATETGTSPDDSATIEAEPERRPRVFRAQQPVLAPDVSSESDPSSLEPPVSPPLPTVATRAPRRRASPVVVTTFVVQPEAEVPIDDPPATTPPPALKRAEALARQLREVDVVLTAIREAQRFQVMPVRSGSADRIRSFMTVNAELAQLRERAEQLRRQETASVVKWIRSSIARHALVPEDLFA